MRFIRCPNCNKLLPAQSYFCSACGESLASPTEEMFGSVTPLSGTRGASINPSVEASNSLNIDTASDTPPALKVPPVFVMEAVEKDVAPLVVEGDEQADISITPQEDISIQRIMEGLWEPPTPNGASANGNQNGVLMEERDELDDTIEDAWHSRINWHRDVASRSSILDGPAGGDTPPG